MLCNKAGRATHADYFSNCLTTGVTQGGSYAQDDNNKAAFLDLMVTQVRYCSHNMTLVALHRALRVCVCGVFSICCAWVKNKSICMLH